jgi:endonuclease/exonuclease/phosphatase family metal-dependent hydrolase
LLIRTWNLFHGNTKPPGRKAYLAEMVRLASADGPGVVCLQEIPLWALDRLGEWSGMQAFGAVAARPMLGPLPSTAEVGRVLTAPHHGLFRSAFSGQANAVLVRPELHARGEGSITLNPRRFRRAQSRRLGLDVVARLAWAKERRVCQAVRVWEPEGRSILVANLHATSYPPDERLPDAELFRAATFATALAEPEEVCVLAGDLNVSAARSRTLADLTGPEWGFAGPGQGIDHVLVRGADSAEPTPWPDERRSAHGRLLSDHAPVQVRIA